MFSQLRPKWLSTVVLILALTVIGCRPQAEAADPTAAVSSSADNSDETTTRIEPNSFNEMLVTTPSSTSLPSATPSPSPRLQPTSIPTATPTPTLSPTFTPPPTPSLRQLTTGGCCTQPFWSPDSKQVLYIDQPAPDAPLGIWGQDIARPEHEPELITEHIAFYTADLTLRIELDEDTTTIERLPVPLTEADTQSEAPLESWTVPAGGRRISISPGQTRIAWQVSNPDLPPERQITQVWVANLDGTEAEAVATLPRGGVGGWVSDDMLLVSSRESLQSREQILYTLSLSDGRLTELVRAERLRGGLVSPDGTWLAYYIALNEDPTQNGLWLVRTDGTEQRKLDRNLFGAYQWRDSNRLLIIPFQPEAAAHEIWEFNVETEKHCRLTDPAVTPFKIANGDWTISPDGEYVVFVESRDRNIWVLELVARC
jgi:Tol biopolymer transport system component